MKKKSCPPHCCYCIGFCVFYIYFTFSSQEIYLQQQQRCATTHRKKYRVVAFVDQSRKIYEETELNLFLNVFRYKTSVKYEKKKHNCK